jgi:flagellar protein FlaG
VLVKEGRRMKVQGSLDLKKTELMPQMNAAFGVERSKHAGTEGALEKAAKRLEKEAEPGEEPDRLEVEEAVEALNNSMEYINRALRFSIHEDTQRLQVRVVNLDTDEVIKEIPPEEVLDTVARIREMIGVLVDKRA